MIKLSVFHHQDVYYICVAVVTLAKDNNIIMQNYIHASRILAVYKQYPLPLKSFVLAKLWSRKSTHYLKRIARPFKINYISDIISIGCLLFLKLVTINPICCNLCSCVHFLASDISLVQTSPQFFLIIWTGIMRGSRKFCCE